MKRSGRLELYVVPFLAAVIPGLFMAGLFSISTQPPVSSKPEKRPLLVRYAVLDMGELAPQSEIAEVRALYSPDLFSTSRGLRFPSMPLSPGGNYLSNMPPLAFPSSYSDFLRAGVSDNGHNLSLSAGRGSPDEVEETVHFRYRGEKPSRPKGSPAFVYSFRGGLRQHRFERDPFSGIVLPAPDSPWSVTAEMYFDGSGNVEHVFAEAGGCPAAVYQQIVRNLYHSRLAGVTQACGGLITAGYAAPSDPAGQKWGK